MSRRASRTTLSLCAAATLSLATAVATAEDPSAPAPPPAAPAPAPASPTPDAPASAPPSSPAPSTPASQDLEPRESYLAPAPDRSALRVESAVPGVAVGIAREEGRGTRELGGTELFWRLCAAPCTLYVRPGVAHVVARGEGLVPSVSDVTIGPNEALRVRMNMRRRSVVDAQSGLYVSGLLLALGGVITAAAGWDAFQHGYPAAFITGVSVGSAGAVLFITALLLNVAYPMGVAELAPYNRPAASARARPRRPRGMNPLYPSLTLGSRGEAALVLGGAF